MTDLHTKEIITCDEMKLLEQMADEAGLSYNQMMENAGTRAAEIIREEYETRFGVINKALILCGKGNNGGDGFVVARKFQEAGIETKVLLVEGEPKTKDAITNYQLIKEKVKILTPDHPYLEGDEDVLVDAVYGTGFRGCLRETAEDVITACNESAIYIASLDLPSGLTGDMSFCEQMRPSIRASLTVAFHGKKPVHRNKHARMMMGRIVVADIGIGEILEKEAEKGN